MSQNIYFTHAATQKYVTKLPFIGKGRPLIQKDGTLKIITGANNISWSYGLNTVTYPTYGGEVVQILSAYIEDMSISGDVNNYRMMEDIYVWFLTYLHLATQGGKQREEPVTLWYPHREWVMKIRPKGLPGLRMARDVVAPTWQMTASIVEGDPDAEAFTLRGAVEGLKEIKADIGFDEENPFSSPTRNKTSYNKEATAGNLTVVSDWFEKIVESWANQDFSSLEAGSTPPRIGATSVEKKRDTR